MVYLNERARLWHLAQEKDLIYLHCEMWPGGRVLTQEAFSVFKALVGLSQFYTAIRIAPDTAAILADDVMVESEIAPYFGL